MRVIRKDKFIAKPIRVIKRVDPALPPTPGKALRANRDPFIKTLKTSESVEEKIRKTATSRREKGQIKEGKKATITYNNSGKNIKQRISDEEKHQAHLRMKALKAQGVKNLAMVVAEEMAKGLIPKRGPDGKTIFFVKP